MSLPTVLQCLLLATSATLTSAVSLDITSASSIRSATSDVAFNLMQYYTGNVTGGTPGNLPAPYFWWEAGAMFGEMVEYWYYTGDTTYNDEVSAALQSQVGTDNDFMPANQTKDEGNDDQVFWGFAAMSAAELNFPAPSDSSDPSWLSLAQAVFNVQADRWDAATCGGGLRWQIFTFNTGYDYKNAISNFGFFQLSARLARYTGNQTYIDWAEKSWDWCTSSVLYDNTTYQINDGTAITTDNTCPQADHTQWSYNYASAIAGLAYMYNHTSNETWLTPLEGLLNTTLTTFFPTSDGNMIMTEITCQPLGNCDTDELSFKAYLSRWLAVTAQLVPSLYDTIYPYLRASATGAAGQCDAGSGGNVCGQEWNTTTWDGTSGVGQQMAGLAVMQAMMIDVDDTLKPPFTSSTGGTSKSNPSAGTGTGETSSGPAVDTDPVTTADKAGAGILTALVLVMLLGGAWWTVAGSD